MTTYSVMFYNEDLMDDEELFVGTLEECREWVATHQTEFDDINENTFIARDGWEMVE